MGLQVVITAAGISCLALTTLNRSIVEDLTRLKMWSCVVGHAIHQNGDRIALGGGRVYMTNAEVAKAQKGNTVLGVIAGDVISGHLSDR